MVDSVRAPEPPRALHWEGSLASHIQLNHLLKLLLGLCLLPLAASCSLAPVQEAAPKRRTEVPLPPSTTQHLRVGVEYLAPEAGIAQRLQGSEASLAEIHPTPTAVAPFVLSHPPPSRETMRPPEETQVRWELDRNQIRLKRSPLERVTLRFISELVGDDRKRVQRAIGAPLLGAQLRRSMDPMWNYLDERDREDHQRALTKNGTRMIKRPLRNALKELPIFNDVESALREFKETNRKYTDQKRRGWGRVSVRLRLSDNPVELIWIRGGLRLASNREYGKAAFSASVSEDLRFSIRSRYHYLDQDWRLFGNLEYRLNDYTTFHALAGNEVNILGGPVSFPGGPQSDRTSKGVLVYFDHQF